MTPKFPESEYAFWAPASGSPKILYPLPLFHEIDFVVNEGFRRIPHGGIELGGLLFGQTEGDSLRIEAFRNIECEHASGPSFVLSERDLTALGNQIEAAKSDPELAGLDALGWFISHTRSPLKINDREAGWFDRFFPGPGKLTILAKPERFQPTRFSFLLRRADGVLERDGIERAIILPLPGRASRTPGEPIPSLTAPPEKPAPAPEPVTIRTPGIAETSPSIPPPAPAPRVQTPLPERKTLVAESLPTIEQVKRRRTEKPEPEPLPNPPVLAPPSPPPPPVVPTAAPEKRTNLRLAIVLIVAALLGCAVGYWGYTQLPAPTIPLTVRSETSALLVSWPAGLTRNATYAALRIDNGDPIPLSSEQKSAGQITIPSKSTNVKIELICQNWLRDSRGIIRYVAADQH
ncbi:MAG TPA: hypothetical protein VFB14_04050 [Bryobacteraceae bacterium]|jgi:hypothetical protein|nr:hypothetical protein [Bryobacteraceae bacterium]